MTEQLEDKEKICGIIRPIAKMSEFYTFEHWNNVKDIVERAIRKAGYDPLTVSDSKGSTTIHSSIFLNLYQNEIVVCDVSNRNANVMFELGMRIAFDKPVVIIKDEKTPFSFDTQHIKHLEYPSDLRFQIIETFIDDLANLISETVQASKEKGYKTFLSHYAPIKVATLEVNEVSEKIALESILGSIKILDEKVSNLQTNNERHKPNLFNEHPIISFVLPDKIKQEELKTLLRTLRNYDPILHCEYENQLGHNSLSVILKPNFTNNPDIEKNIKNQLTRVISETLSS